MKSALLILGLTILYYVILFYFDQKRKAAFKLKKQKVIGQTTALPILKETTEAVTNHSNKQAQAAAFGNSNLTIAKEGQRESMKLTENADIAYQSLESEMEELALDLEAEQTLETSKDNLAHLAATNQEEINQETIANMVANITKRKS